MKLIKSMVILFIGMLYIIFKLVNNRVISDIQYSEKYTRIYIRMFLDSY